MTTIAAVQGNGWAVIGYDSQVSQVEPGGRTYTLPKSSGKVVTNGEYLLGTAGDLRALNLVAYSFKPPAVPEKVNISKFMTSVFVPQLRACFEEHAVGKEGISNAQIIVAVRGKVFEIGEQYDWCQDIDGIYAIGTGAPYALGSLKTSLTKNATLDEAKKSMKTALEVSASLDWGTGLPVTVVSQKTLDKTK